MFDTNVGALALLLLLGGVRADMQETPPASSPRLQLSRLSGRLEVELDKRQDSPASRRLPYLRSGSVIRVLSGSAGFDSDYHVTVRAGEGDEFRFIAIQPEGSRSGSLRFLAGEREPRSLEVSVGSYKFRLRKGGEIAIISLWPGELTVRSEGRGVQLAPGSLAPDGTILAGARRMEPGQAVTVAVPEKPAFENTPIDSSRLSVSPAAGGGFVVSAGAAAEPPVLVRDEQARRLIADWPVVSLRTAEVVIEKYGPPDLAIKDRLAWFDNGPWKMTTVYRDPSEHQDVLEQMIAYKVPQDKVAALAKLDVALRLSRDGRELSATSESEETNFLALNLADEVVREKRSSEEARALYLKTVVQWNAGKSSPYIKGLLFR